MLAVASGPALSTCPLPWSVVLALRMCGHGLI